MVSFVGGWYSVQVMVDRGISICCNLYIRIYKVKDIDKDIWIYVHPYTPVYGYR